VKTGNGQNYADVVGVKEPPMTIEQSVIGVIAQVCLPIHASITKLTKFYKIDALEKSSAASGTFVSYDGTTFPW
jgi:norsolorinic acid ketoreductase